MTDDTSEALTGDQDDGAPARSTARLFIDRSVGAYFFAKLAATIGTWIQSVVAAVVVFDLSGSALLVGAVSIAQFAPQVALAPLMGALADRGNRRGLVMTGRLISALGSGALAIWLAIPGLDSGGALPVVAATLVMGIGFAVSLPAMHTIIPALARPSELSAVVAIAQSPLTIARAAGPALGALLLVTWGPGAAFAVAALGQLVFVLIVWRLPLRPVPHTGSSDARLLAGIHYLRRDLAVALLLLAVAGVGFGVDPVITLSPSIAAGFGAGGELVALLASAFGVGAGAGVLVIGVLRRRFGLPRSGTGGLTLMLVSLCALAASPSPAWAVASQFACGMGMMVAITSLTTQVQLRIPEDLRGRLMALWAICFIGSRPLAAALNGTIADAWSPRAALVVLAVLLGGAALATRPARIARLTPAS